jgi:3-deoxy-D-manno-octulosonic-acid transferase
MTARYFPFDRPRMMKLMVDAVRPRLVGLLETELWPGLLAVLKAMGIPAIMINGRINRSSLKRYMLWPAFWRSLAPDRIMAISSQDAEKFGQLFNQAHITMMPNIKFDHWYRQLRTDTDTDRLERLFEPDRVLAVFGSVRREEEKQVRAVIARVLTQVPEATIAVFPRHMDRLLPWQEFLNRDGVPWVIRSRVDGTIKKGAVVLWDTFGELRDAYTMATAAFVGGSLAPLGGQNFLEALACGVLPVIGPSYYNFLWVGETIFEEGLVCRAVNWEAVAAQMIANLKNPVSHATICRKAERYALDRTGGTRQACRVIEKYLERNLSE